MCSFICNRARPAVLTFLPMLIGSGLLMGCGLLIGCQATPPTTTVATLADTHRIVQQQTLTLPMHDADADPDCACSRDFHHESWDVIAVGAFGAPAVELGVVVDGKRTDRAVVAHVTIELRTTLDIQASLQSYAIGDEFAWNVSRCAQCGGMIRAGSIGIIAKAQGPLVNRNVNQLLEIRSNGQVLQAQPTPAETSPPNRPTLAADPSPAAAIRALRASVDPMQR